MSKIKYKEDSTIAPDPLDCYIGHEHNEMLYIGGPYYQDHAQLHFNLKTARWLAKMLPKYIKKMEKCK